MSLNTPSKQIIITGATGFAGRRLVKALSTVYKRDDIVCLVFNSNSNFEKKGRSIIRAAGIKTIKADLLDPKTLMSLSKNPSLIFHLAAQTDTANPNHSVNDAGTKNLYEALGPLNKHTHFIHISTMVIAAGRLNCAKPINENSKDYPSNEYTRTKLGAEKYLINKCRVDGFRLTVLRPNTIYGKDVRTNSLFDMVKKMIIANSPVTRLNWPGKSALIHLDDFIAYLLTFSNTTPPPGKPSKYLLYTENLSISEISNIMHKKMEVEYRPIILPECFWKIISFTRRFIFLTEPLLPANIYNQFWRFSIIIDNSIRAQTNKAKRATGLKKRKYFKSVVGEVV